MKKEYLYVILALEVVAIILVGVLTFRVYEESDEAHFGNDDGVIAPQTYDPNTATVPPLVGEIGNGADATASEDIGIGDASVPPSQVSGKSKASVFSGRLEKVNKGCFSDGECFVVVGGKHITTLTGLRAYPQPVGSVLGVEGFGDLEKYVGQTVEVYARAETSTTYTLYGSEDFYIKLVTNAAPLPQPTVHARCVVGGCSSELCADASEGDIVSNCMYSEKYACYRTATCERQMSGQCGWTDTPELRQCMFSKNDSTKQRSPDFMQ